MTTLPIVEHLDPFEDVLACFISREIPTMMHEFDFQRVKEAFDHCVSQQLPLRLIEQSIPCVASSR